MDNCDSFHSHVTKKDYKINFVLNYHLSEVVYLFDCVLFGFQYVGSTSTPFRYRFNYKCCCRFSAASSVLQMDLFRSFCEENHHGFLEGMRLQIIDWSAEREIGYMRVSGIICLHLRNFYTPES